MKRYIRIAAYISMLLPIFFIAYLLSGHGSFEDVMNYTPTLRQLIIIVLIAVAAGISAAVDHKFGKDRFPSKVTIALCFLSLAATLYMASYIILPKYIRHGTAQPQLFLKSYLNHRGAFHFAAAGDAHIGAYDSRADLTMKMLKDINGSSKKYDAFFFLGDLVQLGFNDRLWKTALSDMRILKNIPVCYVPGNHDMMFGGDSLFREYALPDKNVPLWRRIDIGNIHFLILDIEWLAQTYTKKQEKWLTQQLSSIPRKDWCIVMSHTFYYCSGERKDGWNWYDNQKVIAKLCPLFEKYSVDLVFSGHMHQTEVLKHNGVTYVVMGSFGGKLDAGRKYISPASVWYKQGQYGFADVTISGNSANLTVRDPDNKVIYKTNIENRR